MNAREMHIDVKQSLSQVGANRTRSFEPEELDLALNKIQNRFIQGCLKPRADGSGGFELDQLSTDKIRTLLRTVSLTPYMKASDKTRYICYLPSDYQNLISDWSFTKMYCDGDDAPVETTVTLYIRSLRQDTTAKGSANYYETMIVILNGKTVSLAADVPYFNTYTGFKSKEDIAFLKDFITLKGRWYWEVFGEDTSYPGRYIAVSESTITDQALTIDGTAVVSVTTSQDTIALIKHAAQGSRTKNRLVGSDQAIDMSGVAFYESTHYSPISELGRGVLYIHRKESGIGNFTVSGVGITYVKKPQPISVSLNTTCELPETFHQTICDLTVEYLKGRLENEKGTVLAENDIQKRVVI